MSILAQAPPGNLRGEALFAAVCLAVALGAAGALRLWRPSRVDLPERLTRRTPAWPLFLVLVAGLLVWFAIPAGFFAYKQVELMAREGPEARIDPEKLSAEDFAFLATVPPVAGFLVLLAGDYLLRHVGRYNLGFGPRRFPSGLVRGILGSICVVPLLFGFMVLLEWLYRVLHYEHPKEHELLRALGETTDPAVKLPLLLGAALVAPLFEELFFRGHFQTILRRGFTLLDPYALKPLRRGFTVLDPDGLNPPTDPASPGGPAGPSVVDSTFAPPSPAWAGVPVALPDAPPPAAEDTPVVPPPWATWAAIIITSALFALVHPLWTAPPIFLLSLCLGYAYERTGNLWVPIIIHAAFNSVSTFLYVAGLSN